MFDSIDRLERVRKNRPSTLTVVAVLSGLVPALLFLACGRKQLGLEAGSFSTGIAIAANLNWKFRRQHWFWIVLLALVVLHGAVLFVLKLPTGWNGKEVTILIVPSVLASLSLFAFAKKQFGVTEQYRKGKHV